MDQVLILDQQILVHVEQHVVHQYGDERVYRSDRVRRLLLLNVVRVRAVHGQALQQFDVVHTTYQGILAIAYAAAKPKHTN